MKLELYVRASGALAPKYTKGNQEHIFISQKDNSRIFLIEDGTDIISV